MNGDLSRYCYFINSSGAVGICQALRSYLGSMSKSKNHDELINYTGVVSGAFFLVYRLDRNLKDLSIFKRESLVIKITKGLIKSPSGIFRILVNIKSFVFKLVVELI